MARKSLSKKIRFEVFKRDNFTCQYCGATPPDVILHIDHIHPVADGGTNDIDNLITACQPCNTGKGARLLSSAPKTLKEKAAAMKEATDQLAEYNKILQDKAIQLEKHAWEVVSALEGFKSVDSCNKEDLQSIKQFLKRMPLQYVIDAAEKADAKFPHRKLAKFKYFCGICWNIIREADCG